MCFISGSVTVYDTTQLPQGEFSRQRFSERPMSSGYFGRLIATGERGVCLLSSCKVRYPQITIICFKFQSLKFYL